MYQWRLSPKTKALFPLPALLSSSFLSSPFLSLIFPFPAAKHPLKPAKKCGYIYVSGASIPLKPRLCSPFPLSSFLPSPFSPFLSLPCRKAPLGTS